MRFLTLLLFLYFDLHYLSYCAVSWQDAINDGNVCKIMYVNTPTCGVSSYYEVRDEAKVNE